MQTHWHFHRNDDEEDPMVSTDMYAVLGSVLDELDATRDYLYQGITPLGEQGMHEQAFRTFKEWETIDTLHSSVKNVIEQHETGIRVRAPLFRSSDKSTDYDDSDESCNLMKTARWVMSQVNRETDLDIYSCTSDDVIRDEDGDWHESYNPSGA